MADLFPDRIETDRLELDALTPETVPVFEFYEHVREGAPHIDEVTEYLTWNPHQTPKATRDFYDHVASKREADEGETYAIRPKACEDGAGEFAGLTGIGVDWDTRTAEFGVWFRKPFWGRGYSGERAGALIELAFERLDLDAVVVSVQRGNEQSRSAVSQYIEAHGGHREGLLRNFMTHQDDTVADIHRYSVTAAEYREATE